MLRTKNCGELREENIGETVTLCGWLANVRDLGYVVFATVRDFFGVTQAVFASDEQKAFVRSVQRESTLRITGKVIKRSSPNPEMSTGMIEIEPLETEVLGRCTEQLPFEIVNSLESREDTRLKYRFLDLRNELNRNKIVLRSQMIKALRDKMYEMGFLEFQTPILTSSSPEGARDYLVPSRVYPGQFYALPQAPQQFKQLLMVSGFDKYFQIAPCFRDEDSRADRSPGEFYQLDVEMSFAGQEDVFAVMEELLPDIFRRFSDWRVDEVPFPRIKFRDAMELYGSDKPDLRNPLVLKNAADIATFVPFFGGKTVKAIIVDECKESRKAIDALVADFKSETVLPAWVRMDESGALVGGIAKFFDAPSKIEAAAALGLKSGGLAFFVASDKSDDKVFGAVRQEIGARFGLIEKNVFKFCWIVDFPMYEYDEENEKIDFSHNPFSMPQGGLDALRNTPPLQITAYQYDIVCNGVELSSGAVRNHDLETMVEAFRIAGYSEEVVENKFAALYNAFKFGAPPHAGIAPGVDRMIMLILNEPNIREVIAFPMNKNARDLLMNAPCAVNEKQLKDVHIRTTDSE